MDFLAIFALLDLEFCIITTYVHISSKFWADYVLCQISFVYNA